MAGEDLSICKVDWDRKAVLQYLHDPNKRELWVGEKRYDGTVAGAVRYFASLPNEKQHRTEMFADAGVIDGRDEDTIIGPGDLKVLAARNDLPEL